VYKIDVAFNLRPSTDQDYFIEHTNYLVAVSTIKKLKFRRLAMKMNAVHSQVCYPLEVNARQRTINNQRSTQKNQMCCFETEIAPGNFSANGTETPMATGQPEEVFCTFHERHFRGFEDMHHHNNSFAIMNNFDPPAVEEIVGKVADSIRSELDTIPDNNTLNTIEANIRNFETTVKEALDNFTKGLLNLVQDQTKLFDPASDELTNANSGFINNDDSNPEAEIPDSENTGDVADTATTSPQPFKFDEFEMKLKEKFFVAWDELIKGLREARDVRDNFVAKGNGAAYASFSGNYEQLMESAISNNHSSEHETFTTSA
jgi:hypothetical protein